MLKRKVPTSRQPDKRKKVVRSPRTKKTAPVAAADAEAQSAVETPPAAAEEATPQETPKAAYGSEYDDLSAANAAPVKAAEQVAAQVQPAGQANDAGAVVNEAKTETGTLLPANAAPAAAADPAAASAASTTTGDTGGSATGPAAEAVAFQNSFSTGVFPQSV